MKFSNIFEYCSSKFPSKEIQLNFLISCCAYFRQSFITLKMISHTLWRKPSTRMVTKSLLIFSASIYFIMIMLTIFVDPNVYKHSVEQLVHDKTGQTVALAGPLHLRCFPFALEAENIILKEAVKKHRTMVRIENLKIYPRFLPLFLGRLVFHVDLRNMHYKSALIPHLKTKITHKQKIIEFLSIQLKLKDGKHEGTLELDKLQIDMNNDIVKYHLSHHGDNCPLVLLLAMLDLRNKLEGTARIKCDLTASGNTLEALKRTLSGELDVEMSDGRFYGIDLVTSLKEAKSIFGTMASGIAKPFVSIGKALKITHPHLEKTPFKNIKVSCKVHNGIIHNHHLSIHHHHYEVKGMGKMNIAHGTIEYRVHAICKDPAHAQYKKHVKLVPLIIHVSGPIEDCKIKPDFDSYLHYIKQ